MFVARRSSRRSRKVVCGLALVCAGVLAAVTGCSSQPSSSSAASGSTSGGYTVALSNSFIGNGWRQSMVKAWTDAANTAKSAGLIKSYKISNAEQNTATSQIAQIQSLILAHVDAITIDSASPTALNPVITQACKAGITVVVFDSLASAPCEYNLSDSFDEWAQAEVDSVLTQMNNKGNLVIVQGVVGSAPNDTAMAVWKKELAKHPGVKVVATLDGENSSSTTQNALVGALPSLPKVDGVLLQEGADGVIKAFQSTGRTLPAVDFDTAGTSLQLWQELHQKNGFTTTAANTDPGQGSAALQEAILLLQKQKIDGKAIPHTLTWPLLTVTQDNLADWAKVTPPTGVASWTWTREGVKSGIAAQLNGKAVASPPVPSVAP